MFFVWTRRAASRVLRLGKEIETEVEILLTVDHPSTGLVKLVAVSRNPPVLTT